MNFSCDQIVAVGGAGGLSTALNLAGEDKVTPISGSDHLH
jgi:hypothetical protein